MRPTRTGIVMVLLSVGLLGVYLCVSAQEGGRSLWTPPPDLPPGETAAPVSKPVGKESGAPTASLPVSTPAKEQGKAAPAAIIPAPVPAAPQPSLPAAEKPLAPTQGIALEEPPAIQPVAGVALPPSPVPPASKPELMLPQPPVLPGPSEGQPGAMPILPALPLTAPSESSSIKVNPEAPLILPPTALEPAKAVKSDPLPKETPQPEIKGPPPPAVVFPEPKKDSAGPMPLESPSPQRPIEKVKTFVIIRTPADNPAPPAPAQGMPVSRADAGLTNSVSRLVPPMNNDSAGALVQLQVPAIAVEKRGSAVLRPGETQSYQIVVRNPSSVSAPLVCVEDDLPAGVRLAGAEPVPLMQGNKAVWNLPDLAPQSERILRLTLQGGAAAALLTQLTVHVSGGKLAPVGPVSAVAAKGEPAPPRFNPETLSVRLLGPSRVSVGKPAVFDIRVTNQSAQAVNGLVLYGFLPEGLITPGVDSRQIEGAVDGLLLPGETKSLKMPTSAVKAGRYSVEVTVKTSAGQKATALTNIEIAADALVVQQAMTARLFAGREADYRIQVTNPTERLLRDVAVFNPLVDGLEFVAASERGMYQANSRTVHWRIEQLAPGETQTLTFRVHGVRAGSHQNKTTVRVNGLPDFSATGVLLVESIADLSMKVIDRNNPLDIGRETVYEIQVVNDGSASSTNVQLQVQFPAGLKPRNAQGATKYSVDRQTVRFEPIAALGPQGQAIYRVSALASAAGDQRVRFAVASDQVQQPIVREISTLVDKGN